MSDLGAVLRWLIALELLGWGLFPLLALLVPGLRDRGLTLTKTFALLVAVYPVWFIAGFGAPIFSGPVLIGCTVLLSLGAWLLAWWVGRRSSTNCSCWQFLRHSWRYVICTELLFFAGFLGYLWFRSYNAQILGTEKPMEMAFLSSAARGNVIPPHDPWLSGYSINYYYLGFVLIAALAKMTGVVSSLAFNLGLATVFGLVLTSSSGILANLLATVRQPDRAYPSVKSLLPGLLGGYLLVIAGNLYAVRDLLEHGQAAIDNWWWGGLGWKASRVVIDSGFPPAIFGPNMQPTETITEFPSFSFILGDLHAHVLALPFTLLALALALDLSLIPIHWQAAAGPRRLLPGPQSLARLVTAALVVGSLYAINSWDLPTYAVIYLAAGGLPLLLSRQRLHLRHWLAAGGFLGATVLLYLPFYTRFTSLVGGQPFDLPEPLASIPLLSKLSTILGVVIWGKTPPDQFFTIYLLPWLAGLFFLAWQWRASWGQHPPTLTRTLLTLVGLGLLATLLQMPVLFLVGLLLLLAWEVLQRWQAADTALTATQRTDAFAIMLIVAAFALVLLTEIFFIHDVFGNRMNTIFKVYYQAWTLLAISTGYVVVRIAAVRRPVASESWRRPASVALGLLILATTVYPVLSARARTEQFSTPQHLDGLEFVRTTLPGEWEGITWVQQNVPPGTVVVEAPGCSYGEVNGLPHDRVSTFAGVTTPLGWFGHEVQWRGGSPALVRALSPRGEAVNRLYSTTDPQAALALLDQLQVRYVYIGVFERRGYAIGGIGADCKAGGNYPPAGLAKFDQLLERVFVSADQQVVIYRRP